MTVVVGLAYLALTGAYSTRLRQLACPARWWASNLPSKGKHSELTRQAASLPVLSLPGDCEAGLQVGLWRVVAWAREE